MILGGINGLIEIARTGVLDSKTSFGEQIQSHLIQLNTFSVDSFLRPSSTSQLESTMLETGMTGNPDDIITYSGMGEMVRCKDSINQHRPGKRRKVPSVESHYHSQSEKKARVTTNEKTCSFCGKTGISKAQNV